MLMTNNMDNGSTQGALKAGWWLIPKISRQETIKSSAADQHGGGLFQVGEENAPGQDAQDKEDCV